MERLTAEQTEAIRKRTEAATEGPWNWRGWGNTLIGRGSRIGYVVKAVKVEIDAEIDVNSKDADFIANAREDVPKLLAEVERLREGLESIAEYTQFDSSEQSAEVAEYYLSGGEA